MMQPENPELELLYRDTFPETAKMVRQLGGDAETAKDLFHDALIIYLEKKQAGILLLQSAPKAYLLGIVRILWYKKFRADVRQVPFSEGIYDDIPEDLYPDECEQSLLHYLRAAGEKCMQLLRSFYYDQLPMQQIATHFGYGTVRSATVQKYKCLEKIRGEVRKSVSHENSLA